MKSKTRMNILFITQAAVIAALYVILTRISGMVGLASNVIQVRISEALCVLVIFTPSAIPGLTIGCFLANLIEGSVGGALVWADILFGTLATFLGAVLGYLIYKLLSGKDPLQKIAVWLVPIPTVLANAFIVPFVLIYAYHVPDAWWFCFLTVGAGELIAAYALGIAFYFAVRKPLGSAIQNHRF